MQKHYRYYRLTDSLVNGIIIIEGNISKASQALGGSVLNQVDVIHMSILREVFRQDQVIGCLLQATNKDLANTDLILAMQRLLNSNRITVIIIIQR